MLLYSQVVYDKIMIHSKDGDIKMTNEYANKEKDIKIIFSYIDSEYFDYSLQNVNIKIDLKSSPDKQKPYYQHIGDNYTLNIPLLILTRSSKNIAEFLFHEMIHLYAAIRNIKVSTRKGVYHNKTFKSLAENRGLIIDRTDNHGWSNLSVPKDHEVIRMIDNLRIKITDDNQIIQEYEKKEEQRKKTKLIGYRCPICKCSVFSSKDVELYCMKCNVPLITKEEYDKLNNN